MASNKWAKGVGCSKVMVEKNANSANKQCGSILDAGNNNNNRRNVQRMWRALMPIAWH